MTADLLISSVLESRGNHPLGGEVRVPLLYQRRSIYSSRRGENFPRRVVPEYSTRVISGGSADQDGDIVNARIQHGMDYDSAMGIVSTRKRVFGNRFKNPRHELLLTSIMPTLSHHASNPANTPEQRENAERELDRHIQYVANGIERSNRRRVWRLSHVNVQQFRSQSGLESHDALDHGISGALPSNFGEIRADSMKRLINNAHTDSKGRPLNNVRPNYHHPSVDHLLISDLKRFFSTHNVKKLAHHDLSHDEVMDWSRSFLNER